ncbi:MAG: hypothetical protein KC620_16625, partial [Myxococcales bacterium]|nr:hypothetical protein [Myxococcales bacterium]
MAGVLRQPDPEVVTPRKAAAVLRRLGLEWAAEPGYVPHPLPPVVPLSLRSPRDWWIDGEALVSYVGQPEDFPHRGNWTCDRDPSGRGECWQVAAAILVHCWNLPELRPLFEAPAWSLDLLDLLRPAEPPPIPERRRGWIRYTLLSSVPPGGALPIERTLIRRSRRDGRVLKPRSLPAELDELVSEVDGLTEADLTLHDVHAALLALQRPPAQTPPERVEAHRARLRARAFACLLDAHDLRFGGEAVHPVARPLTPVLRAVDGAEGLLLSWTPTIVAVFAMGPGYVVTADREFRPLATRHAPRDPLTLLADLPGVPVDEAAEFGTRFVRQSAVPLSLRSAHLPRTVAADDAVGIIRLREDGEALIVSVAIEYRVGEAAVAVDPTDPAPMV